MTELNAEQYQDWIETSALAYVEVMPWTDEHHQAQKWLEIKVLVLQHRLPAS